MRTTAKAVAPTIALATVAVGLLVAGFSAHGENGPAATAPTAASKTGRSNTPTAEDGYRVLRTHRFLPPDFDDEVFDNLWTLWPDPWRTKAQQASPAERRRMAFSYYGLMPDPDADNPYRRAIGYVDDGRGGWVMNCLTCHAGKVAGRVIPGLPNSHLALQTLVEDVRTLKLLKRKPLAHLELASLRIPLATTNGTTNAVVFGIVLGALRDRDMNVVRNRPLPQLVHHDMDPPPLWNVRHKTHLYADGFAPKNHRVLMQFMLLPSNGPDRVRRWEEDFRAILAWIESLRPPKYPFEIDHRLAQRGREVFNRQCARCHGTYDDGRVQWPEKVVPLELVGTDPLRLNSLAPEHRRWLKEGWMSHYGRDPVVLHPKGYVAPPLEGIWATAPYLHNGSVPTLWHLLHPDERPVVWKRTEDGYDRQRVGLEVSTYESVPAEAVLPAIRRRYVDTHLPGKSAAGHRFPERLTEDEKRAVLEYLKTL